MDNQLPAEVLDKLKAEAKSKAGNTTEERSAWFTCATEYATKLLQAEQEIAQLKQWKAEATELLNPILDYGQSKEANIPLGKSITTTVLDRCKQFETARTLLSKFISRHEAGLLPDRFIYQEIKNFLDGTK